MSVTVLAETSAATLAGLKAAGAVILGVIASPEIMTASCVLAAAVTVKYFWPPGATARQGAQDSPVPRKPLPTTEESIRNRHDGIPKDWAPPAPPAPPSQVCSLIFEEDTDVTAPTSANANTATKTTLKTCIYRCPDGTTRKRERLSMTAGMFTPCALVIPWN